MRVLHLFNNPPDICLSYVYTLQTLTEDQQGIFGSKVVEDGLAREQTVRVPSDQYSRAVVMQRQPDSNPR